MSYVVTAALVVTNKPDGSHVYLYHAAPVPSYVKGKQLQDLIDEGMVAKSDAAEDSAAEPARAGAGSSRDAWAAYADSVGVEYASDAGRDDIIAAVDAAK